MINSKGFFFKSIPLGVFRKRELVTIKFHPLERSHRSLTAHSLFVSSSKVQSRTLMVPVLELLLNLRITWDPMPSSKKYLIINHLKLAMHSTTPD